MKSPSMRKFQLGRGYKPVFLYDDELGLACTVNGASKIFRRYLIGAGYKGPFDFEIIESAEGWELGIELINPQMGFWELDL